MSIELRPDDIVSPELNRPALALAIGEAALTAYAALAGPNFLTEPLKTEGMLPDEGPDMIWRLPECLTVSRMMQRSLAARAYRVDTEFHDVWNKAEVGGLRYHQFVVMKDDGQEIIADGTWQQLMKLQAQLDQSTETPLVLPPKAPLVLAGERRAVVEQARRFGITNQRILDLWTLPGRTSRPDDY